MGSARPYDCDYLQVEAYHRLVQMVLLAMLHTSGKRIKSEERLNQPIRLPGLKPGVCSGLILSGAFYADLKIGVTRCRMYQKAHFRPGSLGIVFLN